MGLIISICHHIC
jgi:hypothetical protein